MQNYDQILQELSITATDMEALIQQLEALKQENNEARVIASQLIVALEDFLIETRK